MLHVVIYNIHSLQEKKYDVDPFIELYMKQTHLQMPASFAAITYF